MFRKASRKKSRKSSRDNSKNESRIKRLRPLAGLLATGLSVPAVFAGQSVPFPTYAAGPQPNGWRLGPHVAGGLTLCHYQAFEACRALPALRRAQQPLSGVARGPSSAHPAITADFDA